MELRQWYRHDPEKWPEFQRRYFEELDQNIEPVSCLRRFLANGPLTLVFSSRETQLNNASALKTYLETPHGR